MKRRSFFSKIGKGLIALGIFKALPKNTNEPESEPSDLSIENMPPIKGYVIHSEQVVVLGIVDDSGAFKETNRIPM